MSTFTPGMKILKQRCCAPADEGRGTAGQADPVASLREALQTIENAAYDLADKHPADLIAELILLAAELERVILALAPPAQQMIRRNN